jgi:hypothetical protein
VILGRALGEVARHPEVFATMSFGTYTTAYDYRWAPGGPSMPGILGPKGIKDVGGEDAWSTWSVGWYVNRYPERDIPFLILQSNVGKDSGHTSEFGWQDDPRGWAELNKGRATYVASWSTDFSRELSAGLAKVGLRPVVDIYSTFLQRSYDQVFQEVSLQDLPVVMMMDRAGLVGPDGPTHHGSFDLCYLRHLPNLVVMAPGDASDLSRMVDFALAHDGPTAIRYPKAVAETVQRPDTPIELGTAEVVRSGQDGMIIACGSPLVASLSAADQLQRDVIA